MGLWDTVKSVGWIYDPLTLQFTMDNPIVKVVRQAISIDERRCFYRQNSWGPARAGQDVKQVWFAGVHSDVGGSYPERESGLSQIALEWMIEEAQQFGLVVDQKRYQVVVPEAGQPSAAAVQAGDEDEEREYHAPPDFRGPIHKSLKGLWWLAEFIPKLYHDPREDYRRKLLIPCGRRRWIPEDSLIHESVFCRTGAGISCDPPNLPEEYEVERGTTRSTARNDATAGSAPPAP